MRTLALAAALFAVAPAVAQGGFPDVPRNHWAFAALARMRRDGLLVGYPDGRYRGGRPASRYEMAAVLGAGYENLRNIADGLDAQIRTLTLLPGVAEERGLKDAMKAQVAALRGYAIEIADLQRASDTFELELTRLGVDLRSIRDETTDLAARIAALEGRRGKKEGVKGKGEKVAPLPS